MHKSHVGFILAAGDSRRLKELTKDKPKSFLEINGRKIIDYHLENLSRIGIKKAYIVVGFLKEIFKNTIGTSYKNLIVEYIDNDEFETTGHSYSVYLGKEILKKNDILLIHADVFCDPSLYDILISNRYRDVVLADENYEVLTGDEFVIIGEKGVVKDLGPGKQGKIQGEFVGLSKFSSEFMSEFCNFMEEFFREEGKRFNYEIVMDRFLQNNSSKLYYSKIEGKKWININYKEDYDMAQRIAKNLFIL